MQDGVLSTAGLLAGLSGAVADYHQVVLAALAATAAGALSMGAGAYLSTRAETEVLEGELDRGVRDAADRPYLLQEALLDKLESEGLGREAAYRVVKLLSGSREALVSTAEAKVYGFTRAMLGNAALDGLVMFVAFVAGALVPLVPYLLVAAFPANLAASLATTAIVLFLMGYFQGWLAHRAQMWRSGLRFLAIAMSAAGAGYLIGIAISPLGAAAGQA